MEVLIEQRALAARVGELGATIRADCGTNTPVHLFAILTGAFMCLADLVRAIDGPATCDFMAVSSYAGRTSTSGEVRLLKDLDYSLQGRDVIIVEDIVDTGLTLSYLQEILRAREQRTVRTVRYLSNPRQLVVEDD